LSSGVVSRGMFARPSPRHVVTTQAWAFPRSPGPATPAKGACPCNQPATTCATATDGGPVIAAILIAVTFALCPPDAGPGGPHRRPPRGHAGHHVRAGPWGRSGTVPGGPAIAVAAESVQAGGPVRIGTPYPQVRGRITTTDCSLKVSSETFQCMFGMAMPSYHCGSKSPLSGNSFCSSLIVSIHGVCGCVASRRPHPDGPDRLSPASDRPWPVPRCARRRR
jgi:hypothetical protein